MVSLLQRLPFLQAPKKGSKKRLPQPPAPSLRLGVTSLRHPSAGHRLRLASLAPPLDDCGCAAARYALPSDECLHSAVGNGACESKSQAAEAAYRPAWLGTGAPPLTPISAISQTADAKAQSASTGSCHTRSSGDRSSNPRLGSPHHRPVPTPTTAVRNAPPGR